MGRQWGVLLKVLSGMPLKHVSWSQTPQRHGLRRLRAKRAAWQAGTRPRLVQALMAVPNQLGHSRPPVKKDVALLALTVQLSQGLEFCGGRGGAIRWEPCAATLCAA